MSPSSLPQTFKAAVVTGAGEPLQIKEIPMLEVEDGEVLIKVLACGVCHTDHHVSSGEMGPLRVERLGHEFVGDIVAVPRSEARWKVGDRVGGAWHGGHDGTCKSCGRGDFQLCPNRTNNGFTRNGGYGEYATLRREAAVAVPKDLDPAEVAPLLCAGVTVFNGMRKKNVTAGDIVAIQGLGGLGHLAIQYARKMGYRTVALSRGEGKKDFAMSLGATDYINTAKDDVGKQLQELGGAALIVVTAPNPEVISPLLEGLAPRGTLLTHVGTDGITISTRPLVRNALSLSGWPSGHALDSEEAIAFARTHGVRCMVEKFPLDNAQKAMDYMMSGKVRFRAVLIM